MAFACHAHVDGIDNLEPLTRTRFSVPCQTDSVPRRQAIHLGGGSQHPRRRSCSCSSGEDPCQPDAARPERVSRWRARPSPVPNSKNSVRSWSSTRAHCSALQWIAFEAVQEAQHDPRPIMGMSAISPTPSYWSTASRRAGRADPRVEHHRRTASPFSLSKILPGRLEHHLVRIDRSSGPTAAVPRAAPATGLASSCTAASTVCAFAHPRRIEHRPHRDHLQHLARDRAPARSRHGPCYRDHIAGDRVHMFASPGRTTRSGARATREHRQTFRYGRRHRTPRSEHR